jgi:(S)-2-hydroxyglutarate dehydrogenase
MQGNDLERSATNLKYCLCSVPHSLETLPGKQSQGGNKRCCEGDRHVTCRAHLRKEFVCAETRVAIIGAGIVGLAIGLELTERCPEARVAVIEKEPSVACHQSSHNSGVVHSGIYYKPGTLKATLCVEGSRALLQFAEIHGVPYQVCGKLIVATRREELGQLEELYRRGQGNGLRGLRLLEPGQIGDLEPYAKGIRGIHVPGTAIIDYRTVAEKYAELITGRGGKIYLSHAVTGLRRRGSKTTIETTGGPISAQLVINCAGLQSDRISRMAGAPLDLAIVPFRGEYYEIAPAKQHMVRGLIYPVPDPQFPFLGVHFTRRIGGGVEAGPNAVLALKREGYSKWSFDLADTVGYLAFRGFWRMASKHWRMSLGEYHRSWSKAAFLRALQKLIPDLRAEDLIAGGAGVRAQALNIQGRLIEDFHITYTDGMVHLANVPSPAATASLAVAKHIVNTILRGNDSIPAINK